MTQTVWREGLKLPVDPNTVEDYSVDWSAWLGTDSLTSVAATTATNVTAGAVVLSGNVSVIRLSGFAEPAVLTLRATSSTGRVVDRTLRFNVFEH